MNIFSKSTYDYLVVGLGNPGEEYDNTRHNVGFMTIDHILDKEYSGLGKSKFQSLVYDIKLENKRILLMKPQIYMNNSGIAVQEASKFYKISNKNIIIIFDDITIDVGKLRIRRNGSSGGHNGIKSIISHLGTEDFPRIKIGVGNKPNPEYDLAKWVLSQFRSEDMKSVNKSIEDADSALRFIIKGDIEGAMSQFN